MIYDSKSIHFVSTALLNSPTAPWHTLRERTNSETPCSFTLSYSISFHYARLFCSLDFISFFLFIFDKKRNTIFVIFWFGEILIRHKGSQYRGWHGGTGIEKENKNKSYLHVVYISFWLLLFVIVFSNAMIIPEVILENGNKQFPSFQCHIFRNIRLITVFSCSIEWKFLSLLTYYEEWVSPVRWSFARLHSAIPLWTKSKRIPVLQDSLEVQMWIILKKFSSLLPQQISQTQHLFSFRMQCTRFNRKISGINYPGFRFIINCAFHSIG